MYDEKKFGNLIKFLRLQKKMTVEKMSYELHISDSYLIKLERGEQIPSIDVAINILNYYGISFENYLSVANNDFGEIYLNILSQLSNVQSEEELKFLYELLKELIILGEEKYV